MATTTSDHAGNIAYRLLQQRLIDLAARSDRQLGRLTRLNHFSNFLLGHGNHIDVASTFAESILEVLDLEVGAVWIFDRQGVPVEFAACGFTADPAQHLPIGSVLAKNCKSAATVLLDSSCLNVLPGVHLGEAALSRGSSYNEEETVLLLAGNLSSEQGLYEDISDDILAILTALAKKCGAHLDYRVSVRQMQEQLAALRASEDRLELVLEGTGEGWWDWTIPENKCVYSRQWRKMLGWDPNPVEGEGFWLEAVDGEQREEFRFQLEETLQGTNQVLERELTFRRKDGSLLVVLVRGIIRRDTAQNAIRFAGSIQDLTERKRHEAHIRRLALYDSLTELPNRRYFEERLQQALVERSRTGQILALLMLDLDHFKTLNDTHGHAMGDALLRQVAQRLLGAVRSIDMVARLGGDEFVVLLENLGNSLESASQNALRVGQKLLRVLNEPYVLEVGVLHHGSSIGIAVADVPEMSGGVLLKNADVALYQAKEGGRNNVQFFRAEMQEKIALQASLDQRLRDALEKDRLCLYYQAQVDVKGTLVGAEALMRWFSPDGIPVSPAEFIPVAEKSGLIHKMGAVGLRWACRQIVSWKSTLPSPFRLSYNVSASEFLHPDFVERVTGVLKEEGVAGHRLCLELTEATVLTELGVAAAKMDALGELGIEFSLDDFGKGYSSLSYLRHLPVAEVKIDHSYVSRLLHDPHDAAIIRSILALCSALDIRVIAEGVETEEEWRALRAFGCRYFQGYLFGRPMKASPDVLSLTNPLQKQFSITPPSPASGHGA